MCARRNARLSQKDVGRASQEKELVAMNSVPLRVYHGPSGEIGAETSQAEDARETVRVPLGEVLPLLAEAVQAERTWLTDFDDDEIAISMDLYEVILAYQHYRRPLSG